eukprot:7962893-Ditylum_brightwellii.AAC.1
MQDKITDYFYRIGDNNTRDNPKPSNSITTLLNNSIAPRPERASSTRNYRNTSTKRHTFSQNHVVHFVLHLQPPHEEI